MLPGFHYVPFGDAEALRKAITPKICAVMLEPVQGEGGVRVAPPGYLAAVRQICDEHNLLLVFDEVQVGCGRTGSLFAYQQAGVAPDIMTLAKALAGGPPIGAMIATEQIDECFGPGSHGSTFGGNPLMATAALATIRTLIEDGVLDNCVAMGNYLRSRLEEFKARYPFITEIRGQGLILGMELTIPGADIVSRALERGLLINCTANTVLRFLPPLIVTPEEIDEALAILDGILQDI
jgi:acetylornithine aminotransferase